MPSLISEELPADQQAIQLADTHALGNPEKLMDVAHWYAVYTCANREKQVAAQFVSRGIEHFLPLYQSVREWSDRRVKLQMPLFPGYLFVSTALRNRLRILTVPGVVNLVHSAGQPLPLAADVIGQLRDGVMRASAQPFPALPVGQRVYVRSGPLRGWNGVLLRHKSGMRVVISIDLIQRCFVADVDAADLVPDGPVLRVDELRKQGDFRTAAVHRGKDFPFRTP